jgi:serine phosphatase RsbU (regulator of sigma subunit)
MLVSVMVGAIRGVAAFTSDPAELLENLNERLVGRVHGGFATALVARIEADGRVAIANAGHPSPYLDGVELALPGALPLGIESGARYEVLHDSIPSGGRLTFYSDGVIEAMDAKGEMLGFERAQAISTERADEILKKALGFGQQDDITVITIDRTLEIAAAA